MKREVELAKRLLESKGYKVSKRVDESYSKVVYDTLIDLGVEYDDISEEDGVVYVSNSTPYDNTQLDRIYSELKSADSSGFEDHNHIMWFSFPELDESTVPIDAVKANRK